MDRWNSADKPGYFWIRAVVSLLIAGAAYLVSALVLALVGFTYDAIPGIPIIGNPRALLLYKVVLFVVPFVLTALYLRSVFRNRKKRTFETILALLLIWVAEKLAILGISSMIYGLAIWDLPQLMHRISSGGDQSAPWFTWDYVFLTLAGCVILGLLASKTRSINR
jgi:hypothetical protein